MEQKRVFLALEIPSQQRDELAKISKALKSRLNGKASFVAVENLHLSLYFLGDKTLGEVEGIAGALDGVAGGGEFLATTTGIGFFPSRDRVNIVWAGLGGGKVEAIELHEKLCGLLGVERDEKFTPHITLARVKSLENKKEFVEFAEALKFRALWKASLVSLVESALTSEGPEYRELKSVRL